jgi:hypothetical protein
MHKIEYFLDNEIYLEAQSLKLFFCTEQVPYGVKIRAFG